MTKVRKNILLISIFFCVVLFPACFFSQVNLTNYPPSLDGLQSANCFDLLQDKNGVLWIATEDGLSRFNGTQFTAIKQKDGLSNDLIHDLELFDTDHILVGSRGGLDMINIYNDSITNVLHSLEFGEIGKIHYDSISNQIHLYKKHVRNSKLFSINEEKYHKVLNGTDFSISTNKTMIYKRIVIDTLQFQFEIDVFGKQKYFIIHENNKIRLKSKQLIITNIFNYNGQICAATSEGLKRIKRDSLHDFALNGFNMTYSYQINDNLYFISNNQLYEYNGSRTTFLLNILEYGSGIISLLLDREQHFWIGSGSGLLKVENSPFNNYGKKNNLIGSPYCIKRDPFGKLWISTGNGLFCKEDSAKIFFQASKFGAYTFDFTAQNKLLFHISGSGFCTIDVNTFEFEILKIKSNLLSDAVLNRVNTFVKNGRVRNMTKDKFGQFWAVVEGGGNKGMILQLDQGLKLVRYFDNNIHARSYSVFDNTPMKKTLGGWLPSVFVDSQNRVWFRSAHGLSMINGNTYRYFYRKDFKPEINDGIYMMREDAYGNIVYAAEEGLYKLILAGNDIKKVLRFTSEHGISSKKIYSIEFTKDGHLLAGASNGLNKILNFDTVTTLQKLNVNQYSLKDGLVTSDHITNSTFIDDDQTVWLGQPSNLLHYLPEKDIPNNIPPLLFLDELKLNNESNTRWDIKSGQVGELKYVEDPLFYYDQNDLTFIVKSVTYDGPGSSTYDYFLEGFNSTWEESLEYPYIRYNNLSPGKYTFKARSSNKDGFKSKEIQYPFTIEEPFFQKTWFILLVIFGGITFISGLFILRQRQLKADNLRLEKKVIVRTQQLEEEKQNVEKKNNQILQSINYAKRIQGSILPDQDVLNNFFRNHFVFYQPKDVVGGDFYWFRSFGDLAVIATVDCTGHGVPGGFMSMMGSLLLDKIVQENNLDTAKILDQLNKEIIRVLKQEKEDAMQDGMDLSICVINKKDRLLSFSGARNGIFVLNGNDKKYFDADLFPVGGFYSKKSKEIIRNYHSTKVKLEADSWVFMYTDGYYDQMGGERMLSLGMDLFMAHLSKAVKSSDENVVILKEEYDNWRGDIPPIDDVLVIGFQI